MNKIINLDAEEKSRYACISNDMARACFMLKAREFKILISAISLINPKGDSIPVNVLDYKQIAILTGTVKSKTGITEVRQILAGIITRPIFFSRKKDKGYVIITEYDNEDESMVKLKINDGLAGHLLLDNKDVDGSSSTKKFYTKINIKYFNRLKTAYSMRLYIYFKSYQSRFSTEPMGLDDFEFILGRNKAITNVKAFNRDVVRKSIKEINEKTDIFIEETIMKSSTGPIYKFRITPNKQRKKEDEVADLDKEVAVTDKLLEKSVDLEVFCNIVKSTLGIEDVFLIAQTLINNNNDSRAAYNELKDNISGELDVVS